MSDPVIVRMYNMGFGDCFLLTLPAPNRPRKVLIDCGFHSVGPGPNKIKDVVERIVQDVHEDGEPIIDVVIATHRHRDHVYGFEQKAWDTVKVSEVWMPWTEHRTDAEAVRIRTAQARKALRLARAFEKMKLSATERRTLLELVENSAEWVNAKAMNTLHNGFAGSPSRRFLPTRGNRARLRPRRLPGVTVHVLGPSRTESVIRDMDPPEDESFLRMGVGAPESERPSPAFDTKWRLSRGNFDKWLAKQRKAKPRPAQPSPDASSYASWWVQAVGLTPREVKAVESSAEDDPLLAAVALDKAVNGTSLLLSFEVGRAFLLFPGDAQYGTWEAALNHAGSREILEQTSFYKVGHHGSHNATPKSFVEVIPKNFVGMVPTRSTSRFPEIPRLPLLAALGKKSKKIARADDEAASLKSPFKAVDEFAIETRVPT